MALCAGPTPPIDNGRTERSWGMGPLWDEDVNDNAMTRAQGLEQPKTSQVDIAAKQKRRPALTHVAKHHFNRKPAALEVVQQPIITVIRDLYGLSQMT